MWGVGVSLSPLSSSPLPLLWKNDAETEASKVWNCLTLELDIAVKTEVFRLWVFWTSL